MAERNPVVDEWISKAEGDWEALEILLTRNSPMLALLRGRDGSRVAGAG